MEERYIQRLYNTVGAIGHQFESGISAHTATLENRISHQPHKLKIVGSTPTVATMRGLAQLAERLLIFIVPCLIKHKIDRKIHTAI